MKDKRQRIALSWPYWDAPVMSPMLHSQPLTPIPMCPSAVYPILSTASLTLNTIHPVISSTSVTPTGTCHNDPCFSLGGMNNSHKCHNMVAEKTSSRTEIQSAKVGIENKYLRTSMSSPIIRSTPRLAPRDYLDVPRYTNFTRTFNKKTEYDPNVSSVHDNLANTNMNYISACRGHTPVGLAPLCVSCIHPNVPLTTRYPLILPLTLASTSSHVQPSFIPALQGSNFHLRKLSTDIHNRMAASFPLETRTLQSSTNLDPYHNNRIDSPPSINLKLESTLPPNTLLVDKTNSESLSLNINPKNSPQQKTTHSGRLSTSSDDTKDNNNGGEFLISPPRSPDIIVDQDEPSSSCVLTGNL